MPKGTRSSARASSVPRATALPCMSVCMSSMPVNGLRLVPPVSNTTPLPTRARLACDPRWGRYCTLRMPASRVALPRATARNAPAPSFASSRSPRNRQVMPRGFASASIALRYAAIVNTLGGRAVNHRATLLPNACARTASRSWLLRAPKRRKLERRVSRSLLCDLNDGSAKAAALAAATRLSTATRSAGASRPTSAMPSVRGLSRKHSRTTFAAQVSAAKPGSAPKAPTVKPVARAFAARELASSAPLRADRPSSAARCLPYGRRPSAEFAPRAVTTSKWSKRSSVVRVGASDVAVARSGEKSGSSIIGPLSKRSVAPQVSLP